MKTMALGTSAMTVLALLAAPARPAATRSPAPAHAPEKPARTRVVAYPGPGWTTASTRTSITFRGASLAQLRPVRVVGSRTGVHAGSLVASRVGVGAVFAPDRPFAPGERVRVSAAARIRGARSTAYSFTVAIPVNAPLPPSEPSGQPPRLRPKARVAGSGVHDCTPRVWHFRSRPRLHPVADCVSRRAVGTPPGLIFTTPSPTSPAQHGPTILDQRGNVVWYRPMAYREIYDLSVVTYRGQRVLAFLVRYRRTHEGYRRASVLFLNRHYRLVARVTAKNGYTVDRHEVQVRGGAAWIGAYNPIVDPVSKRRVYEYVVQKIDIRTGELLFEWHSLPTIKTAYSYQPPRKGQVWDYLHGNAIEPVTDGGFLLSARNTSAVYRIAPGGAVRWTMGGKHDRFQIAARHPAWQFCFQHDVRLVGHNRLTVFDNGGRGPGCPGHTARVEEFAYHPATGAIARTADYTSKEASSDGRGYTVSALGSARYLTNGDLMVSWGTSGRITEFTRTHRVDFDLTLARKTYRAARWQWVGDPGGRPAVAAVRTDAQVDVYASWNGSTCVRRWRVFAGASRSHLNSVSARITRTGFETEIPVTTRARYIAVRALDRHGRVLAVSSAITPR